MNISRRILPMVILGGALVLTACGQREPAAATTGSPPAAGATPAAGIVPPPPGNATPTPADSESRQAAEGTDKSGMSKSKQSTVGTAAAGAPPYTLNSAPEGNQAPQQGSKAGEPAKK